MKTLFGKILITAIGVVALTLVILVTVAALDFRLGSRREPPFAAMMTLQLAEAVYAYESGGPAALVQTLERFRKVTGATCVLTDLNGRDLVTGKDRSDLKQMARRRPPQGRGFRGRGPGEGRGSDDGDRPPFGPLRERGETSFFRLIFGGFSGPVVARTSLDGQYIFFLIPQRRGFLSWFVQPELHLGILLLLAVICWWFARHLTTPVRQLQVAVDRFGHGDLDARVGSERKDELGQLARAFDRMADRTVTLLSAERRLLLDISHELRSPLARLSLAVELARSGEDLDRHLSRIQKEADRLNGMVTELLQVTRVEGDESRMRREDVRLDQLVQSIISDVQIEAEQRKTTIECRELPEVQISADPELLRRAIENVLRNAVRYAPEGTAIDVSLRTNGSHTIAIRDYGPGVPEEDLERIFDPFYRVETDRNRARGGVGLGLAIAKRSVQLHQGSIRAANAKPGLQVDIALPA